jgi:predicted RNA-binding protein YlqC (UPF0109 family)
MTAIFDVLFLPFGWSVVAGITFWSIVLGAVFLKLYGMVTNQDALKDVKRRMSAAVLEVRLFQQDIGVLLSAQGRLFRAVGRYTYQAGISIVVLLPVAVLVMTQFAVRKGIEPLPPNRKVDVTVQLSPDAPPGPPPALQGDGVELLGEPIRVGSEVVYKIKPRVAGEHEIALTYGEESVKVPIYVGEGDFPGRLYGRTSKANLAEDVEYPGGPRLPEESQFELIEVDYPEVESILGVGAWFGLPAAIWYFGIISMIAGLLMKDKLGVEL